MNFNSTLGIFSVPDTVLSAGDTAEHKTHTKIPALTKLAC